MMFLSLSFLPRCVMFQGLSYYQLRRISLPNLWFPVARPSSVSTSEESHPGREFEPRSWISSPSHRRVGE